MNEDFERITAIRESRNVTCKVAGELPKLNESSMQVLTIRRVYEPSNSRWNESS